MQITTIVNSREQIIRCNNTALCYDDNQCARTIATDTAHNKKKTAKHSNFVRKY